MFSSFLTALLLVSASLMVGNGFSPVFAVMHRTAKSGKCLMALGAFFFAKIVFDLLSGAILFTLPQYPVWYICFKVSRKSAFLSATLFYLLSNTVCFFQMGGEGSVAIYPWSAQGYLACMAAGLPYYARSLLATILALPLLNLLLKAGFAPLREVLSPEEKPAVQ